MSMKLPVLSLWPWRSTKGAQPSPKPLRLLAFVHTTLQRAILQA